MVPPPQPGQTTASARDRNREGLGVRSRDHTGGDIAGERVVVVPTTHFVADSQLRNRRLDAVPFDLRVGLQQDDDIFGNTHGRGGTDRQPAVVDVDRGDDPLVVQGLAEVEGGEVGSVEGLRRQTAEQTDNRDRQECNDVDVFHNCFVVLYLPSGGGGVPA